MKTIQRLADRFTRSDIEIPEKGYRFVAVYGISSVFVQFLNLLLISIVTKNVAPLKVGVWMQILVTIHLLQVPVTLGLSLSLARFLASMDGAREISKKFHACLVAVVCGNVALWLGSLTFSRRLASLVFGSEQFESYLTFLFAHLFLTCVQVLLVGFCRGRHRYLLMCVLELTFIAANVLVFGGCLIFVGLDFNASYALSLFVQGVVLLIFYLVFVVGSAPIGISFSGLREFLYYSVPMIPNAVLIGFVDTADRYILAQYDGLESVASYTTVIKFCGLLTFAYTPIITIIYTYLSRYWDKGDNEQVKSMLNGAMLSYVVLVTPLFVAFVPICRFALYHLTSATYMASPKIIFCVSVAVVMSGIFQFSVLVFHLIKKTYFNLITFVLASSLNILMNLILIPSFGSGGAAFSRVVGYLVMSVVVYNWARMYIRITLPWTVVVKTVAVSSVTLAPLFFVSIYQTYLFVLVLVVSMALCYLALRIVRCDPIVSLKSIFAVRS